MGHVNRALDGGSPIEELNGFVRAESAFYPDLAGVVDQLMAAWVESHPPSREDE